MATFLKTNQETAIRFSDISRLTVSCAEGYLGIKTANNPMEYILTENFDLTIEEAVVAVEIASKLTPILCTWGELWAFYQAYHAPREEKRPTLTNRSTLTW